MVQPIGNDAPIQNRYTGRIAAGNARPTAETTTASVQRIWGTSQVAVGGPLPINPFLHAITVPASTKKTNHMMANCRSCFRSGFQLISMSAIGGSVQFERLQVLVAILRE